MKQHPVFLGLLACSLAYGQSVGIGTALPDPSARLHIEDNQRGLLIPRLGLSARNVAAPVVNPAIGLLVFNTATAGAGANRVWPGFYWWNGSEWVRLLVYPNEAWQIEGNFGTNPAIHFLGTIDNQPLRIRVNNQQTLQFNTNFSIQRDAGGNPRGNEAIDLQLTRAAATQVASGDFSTIVGGRNNTAGGFASVVGGGENNTCSGGNSFIGGGMSNRIEASQSCIVGGAGNRIPLPTTPGAFIGGGSSNTVSGWGGVIVGGSLNRAEGLASFVGGGQRNIAQEVVSVVCGGNENKARAQSSAIVGGTLNEVVGEGGFIGGGSDNLARGRFSVIGGGGAAPNSTMGNRVYDAYCTIAGGASNRAGSDDADEDNALGATVGGGIENEAIDLYSTISGGYQNKILNPVQIIAFSVGATIGGGQANQAFGPSTTIGGGLGNYVGSSCSSTIAGGHDNYTAPSTFHAFIGGGFSNRILGGDESAIVCGNSNRLNGSHSVICGGYANDVNADMVMVFGQNVDPTTNESFRVYLFGDGANTNPPRTSGFLVINRLDGDHPIHVGTNGTNGNGAYLSAGGTWTNASSRYKKDRFTPLSAQEVLQKIQQLSIQGWYYKGTQEYHIGPFAEDFYAAFGTGIQDMPEYARTSLAASDVAGVALVGIQALTQENASLKEENAQLKAQLEALQKEVRALRSVEETFQSQLSTLRMLEAENASMRDALYHLEKRLQDLEKQIYPVSSR